MKLLRYIVARRAIWSLRIQVFVSGAVIMALELVGSRLLIPVWGNSIFVWGSLIGVVLTGLSIGYYYGGRLADRSPALSTFSSIVFSGGLYTVIIPFISPVIIDFTLRLGLGDRYGPLLGTSVILGPPAVLLGMLAPYAVRIATDTLTSLGNVAGNLYSLSTVGSIFGTFFTVFVLIPSFEIRSIVFGLGLSLMAVSLLGLTRGPLLLFLFIAILLLSPLSSFAVGLYSHTGNLVFEKETPYSHLDVVDRGNTRTLYLNGMSNSAMYLNDSSNLVFTYTRYFQLGFLFNPHIRDVLFVGGGGFSGPKNFLDTYQDVRVDVVEIDPDVIAVANEFFDVREDPRLTVINGDARRYLTESERTYDLIVLDAYSKVYVPFHLMTVEFYRLLHSRLTPDGVVVSN
ncbi:MAG: spermidine synthase, partial [Candidatus Geothermarchaeales archaeon]